MIVRKYKERMESLPPHWKKVGKYIFNVYIAWCIIADIIIVGGIIYLIFF